MVRQSSEAQHSESLPRAAAWKMGRSRGEGFGGQKGRGSAGSRLQALGVGRGAVPQQKRFGHPGGLRSQQLASAHPRRGCRTWEAVGLRVRWTCDPKKGRAVGAGWRASGPPGGAGGARETGGVRAEERREGKGDGGGSRGVFSQEARLG